MERNEVEVVVDKKPKHWVVEVKVHPDLEFCRMLYVNDVCVAMVNLLDAQISILRHPERFQTSIDLTNNEQEKVSAKPLFRVMGISVGNRLECSGMLRMGYLVRLHVLITHPVSDGTDEEAVFLVSASV
jgi:hypothetical protein